MNMDWLPWVIRAILIVVGIIAAIIVCVKWTPSMQHHYVATLFNPF